MNIEEAMTLQALMTGLGAAGFTLWFVRERVSTRDGMSPQWRCELRTRTGTESYGGCADTLFGALYQAATQAGVG